jgi:hypothetical protein
LCDKFKRWVRHVASVEREEVHTGFWWGNLKARDHLEDLCIYGRIILKRIFNKLMAVAWT